MILSAGGYVLGNELSALFITHQRSPWWFIAICVVVVELTFAGFTTWLQYKKGI
jgi:hypothetical protein